MNNKIINKYKQTTKTSHKFIFCKNQNVSFLYFPFSVQQQNNTHDDFDNIAEKFVRNYDFDCCLDLQPSFCSPCALHSRHVMSNASPLVLL